MCAFSYSPLTPTCSRTRSGSFRCCASQAGVTVSSARGFRALWVCAGIARLARARATRTKRGEDIEFSPLGVRWRDDARLSWGEGGDAVTRLCGSCDWANGPLKYVVPGTRYMDRHSTPAKSSARGRTDAAPR